MKLKRWMLVDYGTHLGRLAPLPFVTYYYTRRGAVRARDRFERQVRPQRHFVMRVERRP
jgi:hypothetical protein